MKTLLTTILFVFISSSAHAIHFNSWWAGVGYLYYPDGGMEDRLYNVHSDYNEGGESVNFSFLGITEPHEIRITYEVQFSTYYENVIPPKWIFPNMGNFKEHIIDVSHLIAAGEEYYSHPDWGPFYQIPWYDELPSIINLEREAEFEFYWEVRQHAELVPIDLARSSTPDPIPEPMTMALLGIGLAGVAVKKKFF